MIKNEHITILLIEKEVIKLNETIEHLTDLKQQHEKQGVKLNKEIKEYQYNKQRLLNDMYLLEMSEKNNERS